jgi:hypothetical protein
VIISNGLEEAEIWEGKTKTELKKLQIKNKWLNKKEETKTES